MSSIEHRRNTTTGIDSWRVRFRHGGSNRAVTFVTKDRAETWRRVLDTIGADRALELLADVKPETTATVADQIDHHIAHLTGVTEGTRRRYQQVTDAHLRPYFSRILLADLTRDGVSAWHNSLTALPEDTRPSPKTIRNWHGLLSSALASAVRDGKIPANPARGVRLAKRDAGTQEMVFLTYDEADLLLSLVEDYWRPLILLLVLTGIRWGEATALTVGSLDRATSSARIRQAWKQTSSGSMTLGAPKSARSLRTIAVPPEVFDALAPHLKGKKAGDLVITSKRGNPLRSGTFHNTVWQPAARALAERTGKKPRVHDLRHTFASWAIQAGKPLPVIQRQMGHESIQTTVDTYGHLARADFDALLTLGSPLRTPSDPPQIEG